MLHPGELQNCNSCGFCQAACPIYRLTRHEGSCARGHTSHLKALLSGGVQPDDKVRAHFAECLTCRACTTNCPPGVKTDRIVVEGRSRLLTAHRSRLERLIFEKVLSNPTLFRRGMSLLGLGNRPPAQPLLFLMRRLTLLPEGLQRATDMLPRPRGGFLRERLARLGTVSSSTRRELVYFMSCGMNYLRPDAGEATLRVLRALGWNVVVVENICCGLPAYVSGDIDSARRMARQNLTLFSQHRGPIVSDCASCSSFLKEYEQLVGEEAAGFAAQVKDFTELAVEAWQPKLSSTKAPQTVTYHDPCHLSRYQNLRAQPRELLKGLPGLEFRELPEADWCCGGAGTYAIKHPRLSNKVLARKMNNLRSTNADILTTACPGCLLQLEYGVRKDRLPVRVAHISQLLAERL